MEDGRDLDELIELSYELCKVPVSKEKKKKKTKKTKKKKKGKWMKKQLVIIGIITLLVCVGLKEKVDVKWRKVIKMEAN